jgi:phosphoribosylformimino-5-aminoimidazole carboxamide ribotide isomerase
MGIRIIPAIDLLGGRVVRLTQGREESAVVYSDRPEETASAFESAGADWIHVVDLDGAFGRPGVNAAAVERITGSVRAAVELGGGIRDAERIRFWLERGVGRVVLGSAAVRNPGLVAEAVASHGPEAVVAGIDVRNGRVSVAGWTEDGGRDALDFAREMESAGVRLAVVTEISADGMLAGTDARSASRIAESTGLSVIVSGGVGRMEDIDAIARLGIPGITGVIVGKAYYEGRIDLAGAIRRFGQPQPGRTS